jgi:hypothetical protein
MEIKITTFLYKLFMIPILYSILYILTFFAGNQIVNNFATKNNIIEILSLGVIISSIGAFTFTLLIYLITKKIWSALVFKRWFHFTHIIFGYISGLIAVIISIEPILMKDKLITMPINDNFKITALLFFVIVSNHTLFTSLILNNDLQIKKQSVRQFLRRWIDEFMGYRKYR